MPKPDSNRVVLIRVPSTCLSSVPCSWGLPTVIVKLIRQLSDEALQVDHGSLYPALSRLVKQRWIAAKWGRLAQAIAEVMKRRPEEA
jgi:hypothetical protein